MGSIVGVGDASVACGRMRTYRRVGEGIEEFGRGDAEFVAEGEEFEAEWVAHVGRLGRGGVEVEGADGALDFGLGILDFGLRAWSR